jgi:hypothetical protein
VLIVCEGGKTEPKYLGRLRDVHRLSSANIRITPADGTDPLTIVRFAEQEFNAGDYDRVFCVFDRDDHTTYDAALQKIGTMPNFSAITSWPCFELWVLLHFEYTAAPRTRQQALHDVVQHYTAYTKGSDTVYDDLSSTLSEAIKRAKRLAKEGDEQKFQNPATKMHDLVQYLMTLRPA